MTRRILVTGGFGYVGGRVAQSLAAQPDTEVMLGSRLLRERPVWLLSGIPVVMSWNDVGQLRQACSGVDTVVHLAAMNEIEAARDPVGALEVNGVATARLMEAARAEKVGRFIYLSTAHVYGAPLAGRIDEATCPRPVHPYATSHRAAEDVVLAAHAAGSLAGIVVRLSNSFGAPTHPVVERWSLLVNDLCRQVVMTGQMVLRSAGLQRRDFVTLADVGRAIAHLDGLPREKLGDGIFNVGGAWAPSIMDMAMLVAERCDALLGFRPSIIRPEPADGEAGYLLDYRIDKLVGSGFFLESDHEAEIDETLRLCRRAFGIDGECK
ncbi:MAG: SDR family oxidoreductase [Pseudomonadota bacterium]